MNIVLLAGGIGSGMWPLATPKIPKQFIKILKRGQNYESMLQRVYRQVTNNFPSSKVYVSTNKKYLNLAKKQIGKNVNYIIEPIFKNVSLSTIYSIMYLNNKGVKNECITVMPVDFYTTEEFYKNLNKMQKIIERQNNILCVLGIKKCIPKEKYRYMLLDGKKVSMFIESSNVGMDIIKKGGIVNSGIMSYNTSKILKVINEKLNIYKLSDIVALADDLENLCLYKMLKDKFGYDVIGISSEDNFEDIGTLKKIADYIPSELFDNKKVYKIIQSDNKCIEGIISVDVTTNKILSMSRESMSYISII